MSDRPIQKRVWDEEEEERERERERGKKRMSDRPIQKRVWDEEEERETHSKPSQEWLYNHLGMSCALKGSVFE